MKAYIINLESATDRREYMKELLDKYSFIDYEFITGINGNKLSSTQKEQLFNEPEFLQQYGRTPKLGEIGCTLSHRKCFSSLLASEEKMAIIFEDDVESANPDLSEALPALEHIAESDQPIIILLSDWYWYNKSKPLGESYKIANVEYGFFAHSYVINRAAAKIALNYPANYIADHWHVYRKMGINVYGIIPHFFNQKWDGTFNTSIQNSEGGLKNKGLGGCIESLLLRLRLLYLKSIGRFYSNHSQRVENINKP